MRKITVLSVLILVILIGLFWLNRDFYSPPQSQITPEEIYPGVSYEAVDPGKYQVKVLSDQLVSPTRIRMTPDGKHLLVSQLTGEVMGFDRTESGWSDPYLVTRVDTKFPGFPPDEAGLTGIVLSQDFTQNGKLFLLYTYREKEDKVQNRISVATIREKNGQLKGSDPKLIYQANTPGAGSHQITDGVSLSIENKPHLMFAVGEGFKGERAQDPNLEAGKIVLIQEDGRDPLGKRPFVNPKVEALGIRNMYVMTENPDDQNKFLLGDTGPDKYDRLIYTHLGTGTPLNFNWDGDQEKLKLPVPDPDNPKVKDLVIHRLTRTLTFTGLTFLPDNQVLAVVFGQTGSTENKPGKEVWLGRLTNLTGQPQISFQTIIRRVSEAEGKLGNPLGLEVDSLSNNFFFCDILEGRVYQVSKR